MVFVSLRLGLFGSYCRSRDHSAGRALYHNYFGRLGRHGVVCGIGIGIGIGSRQDNKIAGILY